MVKRALQKFGAIAAFALPLAALPALEARADVGPKCKCEAPGASLGTNAAVIGGVMAVGGIAMFVARRRR